MPHLPNYANTQCRAAALPHCRALGFEKCCFGDIFVSEC